MSLKLKIILSIVITIICAFALKTTYDTIWEKGYAAAKSEDQKQVDDLKEKQSEKNIALSNSSNSIVKTIQKNKQIANKQIDTVVDTAINKTVEDIKSPLYAIDGFEDEESTPLILTTEFVKMWNSLNEIGNRNFEGGYDAAY